MKLLSTYLRGKSLTVCFAFPESYDMANIDALNVSIGSKQFTGDDIDISGKVACVRLKSEDTYKLTGDYPIIISIDDKTRGVIPIPVGDIRFVTHRNNLNNASTNEQNDIVIALSITQTTIDVDSVLYDVMKGDKGDAGTIEVGAVTTGDAGTDVFVENVGTSSEAVLNFTIPRGDAGYTPYIGVNGNWFINGVDTGVQAEGDATEAWVAQNYLSKLDVVGELGTSETKVINQKKVTEEFASKVSNIRKQNVLYALQWTVGGYVNKAGNGNIFSSPNLSYTDFIPVVAGKTYNTNIKNSGNAAICFYDQNKVYIADSGVNVDATPFTVPENAYFARLSNTHTQVANADAYITESTGNDIAHLLTNLDKDTINTKIDRKKAADKLILSDLEVLSGERGEDGAVYGGFLPNSGTPDNVTFILEYEDTKEFLRDEIDTFLLKVEDSGGTNLSVRKNSEVISGTYSNKSKATLEIRTLYPQNLYQTLNITNNHYGAALFSIRLKYPIVTVADTMQATLVTPVPSEYSDLLIRLDENGLKIYRESVGIETPIYSFTNLDGTLNDLYESLVSNLDADAFEVKNIAMQGATYKLKDLEYMHDVAMTCDLAKFIGWPPLSAEDGAGDVITDAYPVYFKKSSKGFKHRLVVTIKKIDETANKRLDASFDNLKFVKLHSTAQFGIPGTGYVTVGGDGMRVTKFEFVEDYVTLPIMNYSYHHKIAESQTEEIITQTNTTARLKRLMQYYADNGFVPANFDDLEDYLRGRRPFPEKIYNMSFDDLTGFVYSTYKNLFTKYSSKPVMVMLAIPDDEPYIGERGIPFTDADVNGAYRIGMNIGYHGLDIEKTYPEAHLAYVCYAQWMKFIEIGKLAFERCNAPFVYYTGHIGGNIHLSQEQMMYEAGIQRCIGPSWSETTPFNITNSFNVCGEITKLNDIAIRRFPYAQNDGSEGSTTETSWNAIMTKITLL